jgi:hypothetical protein
VLVRARAFIGGVGRVVVGGARVAAGLLTADPDRQGRGAWMVARGAGLAGGSVGLHYLEYRRGNPET